LFPSGHELPWLYSGSVRKHRKLHHSEFLKVAIFMPVFFCFFFLGGGAFTGRRKITLHKKPYNMQELLQGKTFALRLLPLLLVK